MRRNDMRVIERLNGAGTVMSPSGALTPVRYDLQVLQEEISAGTLEHPHATIPGLKSIRGQIQPVCFFGETELTLEMNDARKMKFFFRDGHGSIVLRQWIG
jgi:hypothetical protein